jgi:glyoxylase-like metal-dependent hydrolase (beta-lactamase superfamily II)
MTFPALSRLATLFILGTSLLGAAHAAAPMVKTSAPGYYRVMLGDFEVTALSDGIVKLPVDQLMTNTTPAQVQAMLAKSYLKAPLETSVNGYLINTGAKLVLIDTGTAKLFGPTLGYLPANLKASGYQPEQVDEIYITHAHGDHIGGLMNGDKMVYPNAVVRLDQRDVDFALNQPQAKDAAPNPLLAYQKAGKLKAFDGDTELVPGIKAIAARGHTPGHSIYAVESKGEKLMIWGDLMHVAAVQFAHPEITINFDKDSTLAMPERKKAYAEAAKQGYLVGVAHISFPGLGHVRAEGAGYVWEPVNYSPLH